MEFKFKTTIWEDVKTDNSIDENRILAALKEGKVTCAEDIYQLKTVDQLLLSCETIDNTSEQMSVEENDNQPTIEVYENGKLIWDNTPKL